MFLSPWSLLYVSCTWYGLLELKPYSWAGRWIDTWARTYRQCWLPKPWIGIPGPPNSPFSPFDLKLTYITWDPTYWEGCLSSQLQACTYVWLRLSFPIALNLVMRRYDVLMDRSWNGSNVCWAPLRISSSSTAGLPSRGYLVPISESSRIDDYEQGRCLGFDFDMRFD